LMEEGRRRDVDLVAVLVVTVVFRMIVGIGAETAGTAGTVEMAEMVEEGEEVGVGLVTVRQPVAADLAVVLTVVLVVEIGLVTNQDVVRKVGDVAHVTSVVAGGELHLNHFATTIIMVMKYIIMERLLLLMHPHRRIITKTNDTTTTTRIEEINVIKGRIIPTDGGIRMTGMRGRTSDNNEIMTKTTTKNNETIQIYHHLTLPRFTRNKNSHHRHSLRNEGSNQTVVPEIIVIGVGVPVGLGMELIVTKRKTVKEIFIVTKTIVQ